MDQFIKPTRRTKPKQQAGKTIAISAFFLLAMALLMSVGKTNFQSTDNINYPNNFAQVSPAMDLS